MPTRKKDIVQPGTEEKIKSAARKVFLEKGYAGARTRDIAEEAGINLALLNYYFRSKEKLFDLVMLENMQQFLVALKDVLNDSTISLNEKIKNIVSNYINLLKSNPDLPLFILSEIRANPAKFASQLKMREIIFHSHFFIQLKEALPANVSPMHFIFNMLGLTVFPFIGSPLLKVAGELNDTAFNQLMEDRKVLIPKWIDLMLVQANAGNTSKKRAR
jgi:AcrR family transcriptional regulator